MGDAEKLVGKRRKAAVVMEIELRAEHEGEQIRADVYAADPPNVITAEFTGDPIPVTRTKGKRGGASIGIEVRKTSGCGIGTNVGDRKSTRLNSSHGYI